MQSPLWYRRRSAVFALIFALGFFGGWISSLTRLGRYEPAFATLGASGGVHGPLIAALCALALVVAAMSLRVWGSSYLSAATAWDQDAHTDRIVIAGPFRYVRHPLYLGNMLLALGLGAAAPLFGWVLIAVANTLFVAALIAYEDAILAEHHGDVFVKYRRAVPGMLPRLWPIAADRSEKPSLRQGLRAESFAMFVIAGVVALFAVPRYGVFLSIGAYVAGVLMQRRIEAR